MKVELNPAFILHRRPYRETSYLLDIFSRNYGRLNLVAKGIRKKGSNKAELLQPYQRLMISWSGKTDLMNLANVEPDNNPYNLKNEMLLTGFYINELIIRILHQHEAHTELFDNYDETLRKLSEGQLNDQGLIRIFEKRLLEVTGYGLVLDHDVETGKVIDPDIYYYYQAERGPTVRMPESPDFEKIAGRTLIDLDHERIVTKEVMNEAKALMRYVLQKHLGPKPLASRNLYKSYLNNFNSE